MAQLFDEHPIPGTVHMLDLDHTMATKHAKGMDDQLLQTIQTTRSIGVQDAKLYPRRASPCKKGNLSLNQREKMYETDIVPPIVVLWLWELPTQ